MPLKEINYDKTHFYKLVCKDLSITDCYVGHTTEWTKRKSDHKLRCSKPNNRCYNLPVYKFMRENGGWENWEMIWIKTLKCENAMEARSEERKYKEELNATLNGNVPSRTREEYREANKDRIKEYRDAHKEETKEYMKEYQQCNKDKLKQYHKDYREENRDKLLEGKKQYYQSKKQEILKQGEQIVNCICGASHRKDGILRHSKSKKKQQNLQNQNNPQE